jgi:hypothetical protein
VRIEMVIRVCSQKILSFFLHVLAGGCHVAIGKGKLSGGDLFNSCIYLHDSWNGIKVSRLCLNHPDEPRIGLICAALPLFPSSVQTHHGRWWEVSQ